MRASPVWTFATTDYNPKWGRWQVRQTAVDWLAWFFSPRRPVKVLRVPHLPNGAQGAMTTREDAHIIVLLKGQHEWMANYALAHELVHVRQTEAIGADNYMAAYDRFEDDLGYSDNPFEAEARDYASRMIRHGARLVVAA